MLLSTVMVVMVLSVIPIIFSCWFSGLPKEGYDWDKSSPYECGFISVKNPGDFSSRFFHLVILFLVWDVEIVLLVPCFQDLFGWSPEGSGAVLFVLILVYGLYYEMMEGTIKWTLHEN
uniref:NADH-ubiquinone oxidoreductase chain 3 n=1 Tax=Saccostrea kegaki TaxID=182713 RepID=A0A193PXU1_9BIVA|nr:NADH dehydrogenase subunit 3 [Saccostrea kegaki]ANI87161.1 NADH dehydrogenase subunit 3 [Saccostrea kegaki]BAV21364.1 NADH dehydrogenase subunit 3 [Saccostrea kegaki]BAV21365.1 NADH dehydrogenase subunit 3 [Saccostrea kegaki]BAV21366.1 NADH dehydrogenase subunit 3 [Saccostrea kegaki]BAV21368.1 NADH dehydrogenase subunit 3 [Saccostrea kegaki]